MCILLAVPGVSVLCAISLIGGENDNDDARRSVKTQVLGELRADGGSPVRGLLKDCKRGYM